MFLPTFREHLLSIFCVLSSREEHGVQRRGMPPRLEELTPEQGDRTTAVAGLSQGLP